jgi:hypothetical protein
MIFPCQMGVARQDGCHLNRHFYAAFFKWSQTGRGVLANWLRLKKSQKLIA